MIFRKRPLVQAIETGFCRGSGGGPTPPPVNENAIFVAPGGTDLAGRRGIGEPYATMSFAMANNTDDLEFIYRAGTYQDFTVANGIPSLHIPRSGIDANNMFILRSYPGETAVLNQGSLANGVSAFNKSFFRILGLTIEDSYGVANDDIGGIFTNGCNDFECLSNHINGVDGPAGTNVGGIRTDNSFNGLLQNNFIQNIRVNGVDNANAACIHGFNQYNMTAVENTIEDSQRGLYHKNSAGRDVGLFGYDFQRNIVRNVSDGCFYDLAGGGQPAHNNQYVRQNLFYGITQNAVYLDTSDPVENSKLIECNNNVLDAGGTARNFFWFTDIDSAIVYNNIMFGALIQDFIRMQASGNGTWTLTESNYNALNDPVRFILNLFGGGSQEIYSTLAAWQGQGYDLNSTQANPLFVDPVTRDYRLQAGSPLIGTGKNGQNYGLYLTGNEQIGSSLAVAA